MDTTQHERLRPKRPRKDRLQVPAALKREAGALWPGFTVESVMQGLTLLGYFERALNTFAGLAQPSPSDYLYAGISAWKVRPEDVATDLLCLAEAKGEVAATVLLAVIRSVHHAESNVKALKRLDSTITGAHPYFQVYLHVIRAWEAEPNKMRGHLHRAQRLLAKDVQAAPATTNYRSVWALFHFDRGEYNHALRHLNTAVDAANHADRSRLEMLKARCLVRLGKADEALASLANISVPGFADMVAEIQAQAYLCQRDFVKAEEYAKLSYKQALVLNREEHIIRGALRLARLTLRQGLDKQASVYLSKVSPQSTELKLYYALIKLELGRLLDPEKTLTRFRAHFAKSGNFYLEGVTLLALCKWLKNSKDFEAALGDLEALVESAGSPQMYQEELFYYPALEQLLLRRGSVMLSKTVLELFTLDHCEVRLNGTPLKLSGKRVELLCYLLDKRETRIDDVVADVLPDKTRKVALNYIHTFKSRLSKMLPCVRITYDPETQHYLVQSSAYVVWDVDEVRRGKASLNERSFMRSNEVGPFIESVQQSLEPLDLSV